MQFRALPTYRKDDYALRADVVRQALEEDTENGLIPFMLSESRLRLVLTACQDAYCTMPIRLVATVGTTNTGTIDHIADIGAVRESTTVLGIFMQFP
jgi:aromatic-L-amino-acid decarboxylase